MQLRAKSTQIHHTLEKNPQKHEQVVILSTIHEQEHQQSSNYIHRFMKLSSHAYTNSQIHLTLVPNIPRKHA